jgi:hypothetical protein
MPQRPLLCLCQAQLLIPQADSLHGSGRGALQACSSEGGTAGGLTLACLPVQGRAAFADNIQSSLIRSW